MYPRTLGPEHVQGDQQSTMLAAIWNAGMVMPRSLKIHLPASANTINTPALTQQASRAILMRCSGVSVGVIARNAGTVARGSIITNSELAASSIYSIRVIPNKARR